MATPGSTGSGNTILALVVFAVVIVVALAVVALMPDNRTSGERMTDAVEALPRGVDEAAGELEDKSPLEKAADKAEDSTEKK